MNKYSCKVILAGMPSGSKAECVVYANNTTDAETVLRMLYNLEGATFTITLTI